MSQHLREQWRRIAQVKVTPGRGPLGYSQSITHRLSIHGDVSEEIKQWRQRVEEDKARWKAENPGKSYIPVDVRRRWEMKVPSGYAYFNPDVADESMNVRAPAPADLIAFVDVSAYSGMVNIAYLAVRPDHRGEGLARELIQAVYDTWPTSIINWGKLMQESIGHLYDWFKEHYPEQTGRGSRWY